MVALLPDCNPQLTTRTGCAISISMQQAKLAAWSWLRKPSHEPPRQACGRPTPGLLDRGSLPCRPCSPASGHRGRIRSVLLSGARRGTGLLTGRHGLFSICSGRDWFFRILDGGHTCAPYGRAGSPTDRNSGSTAHDLNVTNATLATQFYLRVWTPAIATGPLCRGRPAALFRTRTPHELCGYGSGFCPLRLHQCSPGPDRGLAPIGHSKRINAALAIRFIGMVSGRHFISS